MGGLQHPHGVFVLHVVSGRSELKSSCQHGTCLRSHHPSSSSFKLHIMWEERIECRETSQDLLESVFETVHVETYPVNNVRMLEQFQASNPD